MDFLKLRDHGNVVVPIRTEANPSPMKKAATNRQPGQSHTRTTVDEAINHELAKARYLMDDLADHVFGHIVSTELARDILRQFVDCGIIEVFEGMAARYDNDVGSAALDPQSEDVQRAVEQAFEDAKKHGCVRPGAESDRAEPETSTTDGEGHPTDTKGKWKQTDPKGKQKQKQKKATHSFKWTTFPSEPIDEDELVKFLNEVTDHAFDFAQSRLTNVVPKLKHRFAARDAKHHAMPLSYEPDGEDMRPDFVLLPTEAFMDNFKTVNPAYLNFTASRLVGEAKNKDMAAGIEQVQRYARGLKRAQPWVHYVLAMTVTRDKAVFVRGEGSGTERLELILADGRGCIEFIRTLLGLALAEHVDLGQNPGVTLDQETRKCGVNRRSHQTVSSNAPSTATAARMKKTTSGAVSSSAVGSKVATKEPPISSRTRSASKACLTAPRTCSASTACNAISSSSRVHGTFSVLHRQIASESSASSKRGRSDLGDDTHQDTGRKKRKTAEGVVPDKQVVFFPLRVYGHYCLGVLFTSSSIRGRGTTVFCVIDLDSEEKKLALKTSWQDLERVVDQDAVMKRLDEHRGGHRNVIVPLEYVVHVTSDR